MKPIFRVAALGVGLVLLGACASHRDIQPQAKLSAPGSPGELPLAGDADWRVPREYWKQFGDVQLDGLVEEALSGSPSLAQADARIRRAAALTDAASSALLPQLSAGLDVTSQRFSENGMVSPSYAGKTRTNNRLALDAGIDLDLWGKYRRALQGAEAARNFAELEAFAVRVSLSASVVRSYLELDRLFRERALLDEQLALREQIERLQTVRLKAGLDAEIERNAAQQTLALLRIERSQIEERVGLQRNLIAALLGQGPERGQRLSPPRIDDRVEARLPAELPSALLAGRADIQAARWRVEAAASEVDVARAQFYPSVNLAAFLGFSSIGLETLLDPGSRIRGLGPSIHLPVFEAGRLRAGLATRVADYDAAVEQYNASIVEALREVCDQARSLAEAQQQGQVAEEALSLARRGETLMAARVAQGMESRIRLISARLQVLTHERALADLRAHRLEAAAGLMRALGGGYFLADYEPLRKTN